MVSTRAILAACLTAAATAAFAAASPQPFQPPPADPQMRNATPYMLSLKLLDQCLVTQSRLMATTREAVHTPCSCYAKATVAQLSRDELEFLRANGHFDDGARGKALANIDRCKLRRPSGT
jgi:hypothetical protein